MEANGVKKAVALRPITSAKAVLPYLETLDMVLQKSAERMEGAILTMIFSLFL